MAEAVAATAAVTAAVTVTATVMETGTASATVTVTVTNADAEGTRLASLLIRLRREWRRQISVVRSALSAEAAGRTMTVLIGRAAAYLKASATNPERARRGLPSTHCARALSTGMVFRHNVAHARPEDAPMCAGAAMRGFAHRSEHLRCHSSFIITYS